MEQSAGYLAMGLRLGILDSNDVEAWVNAEIAKAETPSDELIELASSGNESIQNIYSMLSGMEEESNDYDVIRHLLSQVKEAQLANIEFCRRLAECLYGVWVDKNYEAPEDLSLIGFLDDEYSLASQGMYGTLEEWHSEFKSFVNQFTKIANA